MSRVVIPRAYMARILSSKPPKRVCPFLTRCGQTAPLPVAGQLDLDVALLTLEGFLVMPFAGVACRVALVPMFGVSQVHIQFRFQTTFDHGFSQFFEQPTFSQQVLGI